MDGKIIELLNWVGHPDPKPGGENLAYRHVRNCSRKIFAVLHRNIGESAVDPVLRK